MAKLHELPDERFVAIGEGCHKTSRPTRDRVRDVTDLGVASLAQTTSVRHRVVGRGWAAGGREITTTKDN
jgi:hypothetical protein